MIKYFAEDMESALIYISSTIPPHSLTLTFTPEEKERLVKSPLFRAVNEAYRAEQLSKASLQIFHKLSHHALVLAPLLKNEIKRLEPH